MFSRCEEKTMDSENGSNGHSAGTDCSTPLTPGPWHIVRSQTCGHLRAAHNYRSDDPRSEFTDADIRLIASAPELLAALQTVLDEECGDEKIAAEFGGYVLDDDVRKQCESAIAKALIANDRVNPVRKED